MPVSPTSPRLHLPSFTRFLASAALLAGLVAAPPARAVDPSQPIDQLLHTRWGSREGAPSDIREIAQTPDGFLWLGTASGLVRFDGVVFTRIAARPGEPSLNIGISALLADRGGALWLGTKNGLLYRLDAGASRPTLVPHEPASGEIHKLAQAVDGTIWAVSRDHVMRQVQGRWDSVPFAGRAVTPSSVISLTVDRQGTAWVGSDTTLYACARGQDRLSPVRPLSYPNKLLTDTEGDAWLSDQQGVRRLSGGASAAPASLKAMGMAQPTGVGTQLQIFDREGGAWAMLDGSLGRLPIPRDWQTRADERRVPRFEAISDRGQDGLTGHLRTTFVDREGDLWIGTSGGLDGLRSTRFKPVLNAEAPIGMAALAAGRDGSVWLPGDQQGMLRWKDGRIAAVPDPAVECQGTRCGMLSASFDTAGRLWIGSRGQLRRWSADGRSVEAVELPAAPALHSASPNAVHAVQVQPDGTLWLAASGGLLFRQRPGQAWEAMKGRDGLPAGGNVRAMRVGPDGALWLGFDRHLLARVDAQGGKARTFDAAQGHLMADTMALLAEAGRVWVGGNDGLALLREADGRFTPLLDEAGVPLRGVSGIVRRPGGELWLNTATGVVRVPAEQVELLLAGRTKRLALERFDAEDGLDGEPPTLRPLPTMALAPDGWIWVATTKGVFRIDPARLERNRIAPTASLQSLNVDGRAWPLGTAELELPAGTTNIEFGYSAASLRMPQRVRFRYRLEGLENEWHEAGVRRSAFYTRVPPGRYRFAVQAANEDGVWGEVERGTALAVAPRLWQTSGFLAAVALLALALLWALHRLRLRRAESRVRLQMQARVAERERIARDLHDTLLQGTTGLVLNFQVAINRLPKDEPRRPEMLSLLDEADRTIDEARERVYALRTGLDADLAAELRRFGEMLAARSGTAFELHEDPVDEGWPCRLDPRVHDELLLMAREAIGNAFRHAQACCVRVVLEGGPQRPTLRVIDDGGGFDPEAAAAAASQRGSWGLVGLRERAAAIGAELAIRSAPARGTEIAITLPPLRRAGRAPAPAWPLRCASWRRAWRGSRARAS